MCKSSLYIALLFCVYYIDDRKDFCTYIIHISTARLLCLLEGPLHINYLGAYSIRLWAQ